MIFRLAIRNLFRKRWRSLLTASGIAVAVAILVWMVCWMDSFNDLLIKGATSLDIGQVQVQSQAYIDKANLYNSFPVSGAHLDEVRKLENVGGAVARVHVYGLVGNEERSQVARITGVQPEDERRVTSVVDGLQAGSWLSETPAGPGPRELVLGAALAKLLQVEVGDELVLFLQAADGSLGNELGKVIGVVKTGSTLIDRNTVFMHIDDVQYVAALDGQAHEVSIKVTDLSAIAEVSAAVAALVTVDGEQDPKRLLVSRTWEKVRPQMSKMVEMNSQSTGVLYCSIYLIAGLGILNAQRMSALERRREFGVLLAVGISPAKLWLSIVVETLVLTLLGAALGAALGATISEYHTVVGLDYSVFSSAENISFMGVSFSERTYFDLELQHVVDPVVVIAFVGILCGLWPATSASRLNPMRAISGRS